jgi:hypothetical protein
VVPMSYGLRRFPVPLVNSPTLTPAKLAANQWNGRRTADNPQGPATPQGIERIRAANARHGFLLRARPASGNPGSENKMGYPTI